MARPWFKKAWTKIVPQVVERSTYVLFSSVALLLLFALWQPMGGVIWNVENASARAILYAIYGIGLVTVLVATFLINHFDLFGLRQVWLNLIGRPYESLPFKTPGLYRYVRHPLYVGWLLSFWATPTMTVAHLVFAVATSLYIFVAIQFEENDLVQAHREYAEYRERVPMLVPVRSTQAPEREAVSSRWRRAAWVGSAASKARAAIFVREHQRLGRSLVVAVTVCVKARLSEAKRDVPRRVVEEA